MGGATATMTGTGGKPRSDVSALTGLVGLAGLLVWIAVCRSWPDIASSLNLPGPRERMVGPSAALMGLVFASGPMVLWSILVEKVHRNPTTGIDWSLKHRRKRDRSVTWTKIGALWITWAILAALYCLGRWYWTDNYAFALDVLATAIAPLVVLSVPYVMWLDRVMIEPRDHSWHFGAMLMGQPGWDPEQVKKHWRAWIIKGFFGAFMLSIVPGGFAHVVNADLSATASNPVALGVMTIELLFLIDVQIGTVGYLVTMRPLDAHIRSGNPFVAGWVAALVCYPPFVWGIIGNGLVFNYEQNTRDWGYWFAGHETLLWIWAGWLVILTGVYAWATVAFGIRFSNLTYRGVITNGPYAFTRHPAYLSKNLFWWCSVLPFLVTSGSYVEMVRNSFFLLLVNGIYFWRAKTEEAHLLLEDARYREYHAWMGGHGLITAPLERLRRALLPRPALASEPIG